MLNPGKKSVTDNLRGQIVDEEFFKFRVKIACFTNNVDVLIREILPEFRKVVEGENIQRNKVRVGMLYLVKVSQLYFVFDYVSN